MIFPTIKTLEELASFESAEALLRAALTRQVVTRLPKIVERDGQHVILLPGEPGYEDAGLPPEAFNPWKL
jgi:hypothetical protein